MPKGIRTSCRDMKGNIHSPIPICFSYFTAIAAVHNIGICDSLLICCTSVTSDLWYTPHYLTRSAVFSDP